MNPERRSGSKWVSLASRRRKSPSGTRRMSAAAWPSSTWSKPSRAELAELRDRVDLDRRALPLRHFAARLNAGGGERGPGSRQARLGVDALFLGHQHLLLPGEDFVGFPGVDARRGTIHGKPAVMAGFSGSHLGLIDLRPGDGCGLAGRGGAGRGPADRATRRKRPGGRAGRVGRLRARSGQGRARGHVAHTSARLSARLATPLHTYFALIADNPIVQLVNEAQRAYAAPLAAARADLASLPILSAAAPFKCGGRSGPYFYTDIAAGRSRSRTWRTSTRTPTP